jgi:hypothetical protein
MAATIPCDPSRHIIIRRVRKDTHGNLKNIAAHHGIELQKVVGRELVKIIDAYPDELKVPPQPCEVCPKLSIAGLPARTKEAAKNIAKHYGISLSDFLKPHLHQIINSQPAHFCQPMVVD